LPMKIKRASLLLLVSCACWAGITTGIAASTEWAIKVHDLRPLPIAVAIGAGIGLWATVGILARGDLDR
jgi:hypothetical protein